jgi:hypothetical protein
MGPLERTAFFLITRNASDYKKQGTSEENHNKDTETKKEPGTPSGNITIKMFSPQKIQIRNNNEKAS